MSNNQKVTPSYMGIKAGMDSVNREVIAQKVADLTKGTPKDLHEKQLQKKRALEVASMLEKIMSFQSHQKFKIREHWETKIKDISEKRPLNRYWAHFDFDMFYVACELLDKPELKDKPCAVGGEDAVLCTANYAARLQGLRSAMPTFIAKSICPQLILFKPDFQKYRNYSSIFRQILGKFDDNLQYQGLDEAYVDMTNFLENHPPEEHQKMIEDIRKQIFEKTGLTVSAGVGANKMLAKIASEVKKPNNQFIIPNEVDKIVQFMKTVKIRKIPGIGPVNEYYLKGLGMQNAGDILKNTDILQICFSDSSCQFFIEAALGLGSIQHSFKQRKSVGRSETFKATDNQSFLVQKLNEIAAKVSVDLQELGYVTNNAVFSYQDESYEKKDKVFNLDGFCKEKQVLVKTVYDKLISVIKHKKVRLLGIRCTHLMKIDEWKRKSLQNFFARKKNPNADESRKYILTEVREKSQFVCPICNQEIDCKNNLSAMNRHVDKCLRQFSNQVPSETTVKKQEMLVKEQLREESEIKEVKKAKSVQGRKNISKTEKDKDKEKGKGNLDAFFKKKP